LGADLGAGVVGTVLAHRLILVWSLKGHAPLDRTESSYRPLHDGDARPDYDREMLNTTRVAATCRRDF
jgi:hypothetical protein